MTVSTLCGGGKLRQPSTEPFGIEEWNGTSKTPSSCKEVKRKKTRNKISNLPLVHVHPYHSFLGQRAGPYQQGDDE